VNNCAKWLAERAGSRHEAGSPAELPLPFMSVIRGVMLSGFVGVVRSVVKVALRTMGIVSGLFMIAGLMVISGGRVMFCGMFVVLRRLAMMLRASLEKLSLKAPCRRFCLGGPCPILPADCDVSVSFL
jgi:hypothetical protein